MWNLPLWIHLEISKLTHGLFIKRPFYPIFRDYIISSSLAKRIQIFPLPPHVYFPQGHEWIGGSRSDGALGHVSGSGHAATNHRDRRITLPIDLPELVEQSSHHEPTDQHVEHFEHDEPSCWTGNDEVRAEEDDKRVQDQGERFFLSLEIQSSFDRFDEKFQRRKLKSEVLDSWKCFSAQDRELDDLTKDLFGIELRPNCAY